MPKEIISVQPGSNTVELRWGTGPDVQIVTRGRDTTRPDQLPGLEEPFETHSMGAGPFRWGFYAEDRGGEFGGWLEDAAATWIVFFDRLHRPVVMWTERDASGAVVEGTCISIDQVNEGWFADLDRSAINRLIKQLRRARDAVFGRDE